MRDIEEDPWISQRMQREDNSFMTTIGHRFCPVCKGSGGGMVYHGYREPPEWEECENCGETGRVDQTGWERGIAILAEQAEAEAALDFRSQ